MPVPASPGRVRAAAALALVAFAGLALVHLVRLPLFEGPDEADNLRYAQFVALEGRPARPALAPTVELEALGRGTFPPLWFATLAPLVVAVGADRWAPTPTVAPDFKRRGGVSALHFRHGRDERRAWSGAAGEVRVLRLATIPWALAALLLVGLCGRAAGGGRTSLGLGALLLAASTPQLQHLAGTITMDVAAAAWGSLALAAGASWIAGPSRPALAAGLAGAGAGLAAMTKLSGLALLPGLALAALLARRRGRAGAGALAACALAWLAAAGPWYAWGWLETGHPLWPWAYQAASPLHAAGGSMQGDPWFDWTVGFGGMLLLTWIGNFGWTAAWIPFPLVVAVGALLLAGLGACVAALARAPRPGPALDRGVLGFLLATLVVFLAAEALYNASFFQPQARHLYPALAAIVVPVAAGLQRLRLLRAVVVLQVALSVGAVAFVLDDFRPAGWNDDPRFAATDLGRGPRPELAPGEAGVEWLGPPEPSAEGAPRLAWRARPGLAYEVLLAVDDPRFEHRPWGGRVVHRALRELPREALEALGRGEVALPAPFWSGLPPGADVRAQVLALGADGAVVARSAVLAFAREASGR